MDKVFILLIIGGLIISLALEILYRMVNNDYLEAKERLEDYHLKNEKLAALEGREYDREQEEKRILSKHGVDYT